MANISRELIEVEATNYYKNYDQDTLFKMLVEEWQRVKPEEMATRGGLSVSDYLRDVVQRIAKGIVRNQDAVAITMGVITSEVLQFAKASGYDLTLYHVPIAIAVAVVAKAVAASIPAGITLKDD